MKNAENTLERAREAASRGDWDSAFDLFSQDEQSLGREDLPLLAEAAYATGHLEVAIEAWERAHVAALKDDDRVAAALAAIRVAIYLLMDTALLSAIRGWVRRAERLLEGCDETPVHAWIAMVRIYERLLSGDFEAARSWAQRTIELGESQGEPAAAAFGRLAEARSLILEGDVEQGLALLDEAAVPVMSGELDSTAVGMLFCELLCASNGLGLYDRADEWTEAYEAWRVRDGVGSLGGRCRVHRAQLLSLRGSWAEAEDEAERACNELRPYLRLEFGWPLTELGRIRLRRGDLDGAEDALLEAHEIGWDPQPALALLRLAQGDVAGADASIRDALSRPLHIYSKELPPNTDLRRAPLLAAAVDIAIAAGDVPRAASAALELEGIAGRFGTKAILAGAAAARGKVRLAEGDPVKARDEFEAACRLWSEVGAPYEIAEARVGLAQSHRAQGSEELARLELEAARSVFDRLGRATELGLDPVTQAPARKSGAGEAPGDNSFVSEGDYWSIAFEGTTIRLRDMKGLSYLVQLLADPGREFHVLDLVSRTRADSSELQRAGVRTQEGHTGPLLDARAKESYKRRLDEIDEDLEEANVLGDLARAERAGAERDYLIRELERAVGLGGRDRRAGSASERARASVTQAVRHALSRIREHDEVLGQHLDLTIRTGTYCAYVPDPRLSMVWKI
jgi:tetratricopeptide (TPR) repeat protein